MFVSKCGCGCRPSHVCVYIIIMLLLVLMKCNEPKRCERYTKSVSILHSKFVLMNAPQAACNSTNAHTYTMRKTNNNSSKSDVGDSGNQYTLRFTKLGAPKVFYTTG